MKKLVASFINDVKSKDHIILFLKDAAFTFVIQTETESVTLLFSKGDISISPHPNMGNLENVILSGSFASIASILTGREKLRTAVKNEQISASSTFRKILFLESLFILASKDDNSNQFSQKISK